MVQYESIYIFLLTLTSCSKQVLPFCLLLVWQGYSLLLKPKKGIFNLGAPSPQNKLQRMKKTIKGEGEGLKISQPAPDPNSTKIHHRIIVRARTKKVHR